MYDNDCDAYYYSVVAKYLKAVFAQIPNKGLNCEKGHYKTNYVSYNQ